MEDEVPNMSVESDVVPVTPGSFGVNSEEDTNLPVSEGYETDDLPSLPPEESSSIQILDNFFAHQNVKFDEPLEEPEEQGERNRRHQEKKQLSAKGSRGKQKQEGEADKQEQEKRIRRQVKNRLSAKRSREKKERTRKEEQKRSVALKEENAWLKISVEDLKDRLANLEVVDAEIRQENDLNRDDLDVHSNTSSVQDLKDLLKIIPSVEKDKCQPSLVGKEEVKVWAKWLWRESLDNQPFPDVRSTLPDSSKIAPSGSGYIPGSNVPFARYSLNNNDYSLSGYEAVRNSDQNYVCERSKIVCSNAPIEYSFESGGPGGSVDETMFDFMDLFQ